MSSERRFRIRVTYAIGQRLAMLSHLEIARSLERMVRRAALPFAVSNGFSPHMKIAFGSALPVGVGGEQEIFDLQLTDYRAPEKVFSALQAVAAPGIEVIDARYIENSAPAASVAYPVAEYRAMLTAPIADLVVPDEIEVTRKKKNKTIKVSDHLQEPPTIDGCCVTFTLVALPSGSLRPDVFLLACLDAIAAADGVDEATRDGELVDIASITRIAQRPRG